ncbi:hypothetical protein B0H17DRAFT_914333, partial [Mycena rosella]
ITPWTSNTTCLTAPTNANGGEIVVEPCDGSASQLWKEIGSTIVVYGNMCLGARSIRAIPHSLD